MVALLETRVSGRQTGDIICKLGFENSFNIETRCFSGGIWLLWRTSSTVEASLSIFARSSKELENGVRSDPGTGGVVEYLDWELGLLFHVACDEEIKAGLFEMAPDKAPGFLRILLYILVLIPKVATLENFTQFRPISLCTVLFKVISKVIVNRLKPFLPKWVMENQTSFVLGRNISINIIITQDVIHSMKRKQGCSEWMVIKLDLEKAYDRLEWAFIEDTLSDLKIPAGLGDLIMSCVTTISTHVLWNGKMMKDFKPSRGIR
ncbi:uncharacterized protein LOC120183869 [Hibiscus syriacus]|uniref:uncharacterized protein LOC120183869 n=1 Tax=Hibiscus syriacus TaxID=106335 RepID=UPI0019205FAE|nr:uncharacterized protein LOC120183869 [Hibiscus syriacus]